VGLVAGGLGAMSVFAWGFTDHEVGYHNENILQLAPWTLPLVVIGVGVALGRHRAKRAAFVLVALATIASAVGFALQALPWFDQVNGPVIAHFLPTWLGATTALRAR
jgi:hypothetical protein